MTARQALWGLTITLVIAGLCAWSQWSQGLAWTPPTW